MTTTQQQDHRFAQEHWCMKATKELRRLDAENQDLRARVQELGEMARENRSKRVIELEGRIAEMEAQMAAIGAGGVEPLRKHVAAPQVVQAAVPETREALGKRLIADVKVANAIATVACQRVAELPDRDSPADWPEAMLVTGDELHMIVREAAIEAQAAPAHHAEGVPAHETCETCQGNGEIVNDWDRYEHPHAGDKGDEAVSPCQDCEGTGEITPAHPTEGVPAQAAALLTTGGQAQEQADAHDAERWIGIGKAIERACMDLPDGTEINVSLEKDAGTVTLIDQDGNEHENFSTDYGFAGVLNEAIDTAMAAQAQQGGAA